MYTYIRFSEGLKTRNTKILIWNRLLEGMSIKFSLWFTNFIIWSFCICIFSIDKSEKLEWWKMLCLFTYSSLHFTSYILRLTMWKLPENDFKSNQCSPFTVYNNRNKIAPWFSLLDMDAYFLFRVSPCHKYFPIDIQWIHTCRQTHNLTLEFTSFTWFSNKCEISPYSCHLEIEWNFLVCPHLIRMIRNKNK